MGHDDDYPSIDPDDLRLGTLVMGYPSGRRRFYKVVGYDASRVHYKLQEVGTYQCDEEEWVDDRVAWVTLRVDPGKHVRDVVDAFYGSDRELLFVEGKYPVKIVPEDYEFTEKRMMDSYDPYAYLGDVLDVNEGDDW